MVEKSKRRTRWYSFWINTFSGVKEVMRYLERGTAVCGRVYRIGHLFHVAILAPHWGGVLANSLFRWYSLHIGGRVFLQREALGLHWDLNPAVFSTTHTQFCLSHLCLFDRKINFQRGPDIVWWLRVKKIRGPVARLDWGNIQTKKWRAHWNV